MADGTTKPVIFISYSHKDRAELDYVKAHLGSIVGLGTVTAWDDNALQIGDDWKGDINSAIDACRVFILLVTCHSLGSKFIREVEVPRVSPRWRAKQVSFCPILVKPCHLDGYPWLDAVNRRPKDGKALSELPEASRDREMAEIVGDIVKSLSARVVDAGGSDAFSATPQSSPALVDYTRLPETPYRRLVGRDVELTALDEAWLDRLTNIVSLVAWGGAGKSAIVNEWLKRLRDDNYRGATAVLGWSFYSQGTKERATSAEGFLDWVLGKLEIKTDNTSATAKAELIADALGRRRVLLVLDGIEPLQHGPGGQQGQLKDQGMRVLLRRFAAIPPAVSHGLIVITSRLEIQDIDQSKRTPGKAGSTQVIDLGRLSDDAGAELLADNGVEGTAKELRSASHEFEGHALALSLLASFLRRRYHGDIRQRDHVGPLLQKSDARGHDHARRVMQAYETEWLKDEPVLSAIMSLVGLFDRPASADCLEALRRAPPIEGLTDKLVDLSSEQWADAVSALREVHLLDPEDLAAPDALDAHPLVREWFGERLRETNESAWKAAHGRLYEYLRDTTKEGGTPTLEDLAPLYQAIAHGCRAGRHQEALDKIYVTRICRRQPDGDLEYYASKKLGASGSDLAALSWFFDKPYAAPVDALRPTDRSYVLNQAALRLRAQGRFAEALPAMRGALRLYEDEPFWLGAAIAAANLSEAELLAGEVAAAVATAKQSVAHADRSGNGFEMTIKRATYADALHVAGQRGEAARTFADAQQRQKETQPVNPLLYSLSGHHYCDLLLAEAQYIAARDQATKTIVIERRNKWLLDIALDTLTLGRADHGLALAGDSTRHMSAARRDEARAARAGLDEAVDGLRAAGTNHHLPRGLLARAAFRRCVSDWDGAARDLDEVEEIAKPGPMRLYLCDVALERARLAFARIEAFALLSGLLEKDNPSKPAVPNAERIAELKNEAEKQLKIAADYIETCGYHRRDEELAELQAVLRGEKKFADLPPRV